jgi:hypothetical protein
MTAENKQQQEQTTTRTMTEADSSRKGRSE